MAGQQGQPKYGFGWPDGRLGGLGPAGSTTPAYGQLFFPKCISAWNGLVQEIAEANTLDLFKSKLAH